VAGAASIRRLDALFDPEGAEPKLLRTSLVAELAIHGPAVVLDIGANVGHWTTCLARCFPASAVHAVEADPRTAATLRQIVRQHPNVTVHELAMQSASGKIRLHSHENPLLSSLLKLDDASRATRTIEVQAVTLNAFVQRTLAACPVPIKIDTEGNDLQVLAGATSTLADERLRAIVMEFGFGPSSRRQVVVQKLLDVLDQHRFRLRALDVAGIYNDALCGNAMFCRFDS
jgi:FkbM family methyltransferase